MSKQYSISDFDDKRDTQEIVKIFDRDMYWLVASPEYFSVEFMLKYRAPIQELRYTGRLKIKVCRTQDRFVGFTAYYMETARQGVLLFLDVNPEFRGKHKGYAEKLLRYALADLKTMGARQVKLVTRTDNQPSQGLYKRVGFYETSRNNGFVYLQYDT